ncbi:MAG TPA: DUF6588 family protein [Saprospiraceae bacterium]|nr:DUF6588 family protein [Saprospiraceae bacterium]
MKKLAITLFTCLLLTNLIKSQDQSIKDYLDSYIDENANPFVQPLADLFSSNINTGIWEWSNFDTKFFVRFKVQAMVSIPSESMRTFEASTTGDFRPQQTRIVPTVIGDKNNIALTGEDTTFYIFPGGYDLKSMTLGTPQLTVGGFLNSEVSARFLSFPLGQDLGSVRFLGMGFRHSLSAYFTDATFDLSVGYFYHHIKASTYLDSDQQMITAHIGKAGKILSGQLMVGYQTSNSKIHYDYIDGDDHYVVDLLLNNHNRWMIETNMGIRLGPVFGSAAISYANHFNIVAGVGLFF